MDYRIRTAQVGDAEAFSPLLASLGYPSDPSALKTRISGILKNPDAALLVAVLEGSDRAIGLLSMHFIPQLGVEGEVARIGFLVIDESCHGSGVGKLLESHAEKLARDRGCDRMEVHCHERRKAAHKFYAKRGYRESPKFFFKLFHEETEAEKEWARTNADGSNVE